MCFPLIQASSSGNVDGRVWGVLPLYAGSVGHEHGTGSVGASVFQWPCLCCIGGCRVGHIRGMPDLNFSDPPFCHKKY